jgi:division/cell wall cluster transcriptional repressor MraZ
MEKMSGFDYNFWEITIEKYGRIKLPTALLKSLPEKERQRFCITHGFGQHIMLWTETAFRKKMEFLNSLNRNIIENKKFRNAFLRNMAFVECDLQDRFVIPKPLMEYYKIDKDAVLLLDNGQIEIWNSIEYHAQFDMSPDALNLMNEKIHSTHELNSFENF